MENEKWSGGPSQYKNLAMHLLSGIAISFFIVLWNREGVNLILIPAILPLFFSLYKMLEIKCISYEITGENLKVKRGILNRKTDDCRLFRVKDISIEEPLLLRFFGLGNIILDTSDKSTPIIKLEALYGAEKLHEALQEAVETERKRKGVRRLRIG